MKLDSRTLMITLGAVSFLLTGALFLNTVSFRKLKGTGYWGAGFLLIAVSVIALGFQGMVPEMFGVTIPNIGIICGAVFIWYGLDLFFETRKTVLPYLAIILIFTAVFLFFIYIRNDIKIRILFVSLILGIIAALSSISIFTHVAGKKRLHYLFPGIIMILIGLFQVIRFAATIFVPVITDYYSSGAAQPLLLLSMLLLFLACTLSLILLTKAKFEIELEESLEELRTINAAKDRFFSIIAHDLRGPVSGMASLLETMHLRRGEIPSNQQDEYYSLMRESSWNTYQLLENLLGWSLSQKDQLKIEPKNLSLADIIDECRSLYRAALKNKNLTLVTGEIDKGMIVADENLLKTVVRNILSNAIKFSNPDGVIKINAVSDKKGMRLSIKDEGTGMAEDVRTQLFQISSGNRTRGTAGEKGRGLGLILCRDIALLHGWNLSINSIPQKGTEVVVEFPPMNGS